MVAPRRGFSRLLMSAAFAGACLPAVAEPPEAEPAAVQVAAPATSSPSVPPAPKLRTIHRQVSRVPLAREYRVLFAGDAAAIAAHERIQQALGRVPKGGVDDVEFKETPLRDVLSRFREILKVPVMIDTKALEDAGFDLDTAITFAGQGTSTGAALRRVLDGINLTWMIRDEALVITTKEKAEENLEIRLYPLPWGVCFQGNGDCDHQAVIDLVTNTVGGPGGWQDGGGNGSIRLQGDGPTAVLVVSQTTAVHDDIEGLLRGLHERDLAEFGGPQDAAAAKTPTVRVHHVADAALRRDLAAKLVDLCNASLPQGADAQAKVTIVGDCLAVQALTPEFHALALQVIRAAAGEQVPERAEMNLGGGFM